MNIAEFGRCVVVFCFILLFHFIFFSVASAQDLNSAPAKTNGHPKMSSHLWKLEKEYKEGTGADRMLAQGMNIGSHDPDKVTVYLMSEPGTSIDNDALDSLGAQIIKQVDNLTKAEVPIDMLTTIADTVNGISFIKTPDRLIPVAVTSEGVNLTGANTFHNAGYTGSGVKVAVFDVGFSGLDSAISAGELPGNVVKVDCTDASCVSSSFSAETEPHGTAVAEIVYDMAPGAALYLIKVTDTIDLVYAKDFAANNGIRIINFSLVVPNTNFYDGECYNSNPVCTADDAYFPPNNILWVNAAGNEAQRHYEAVFSDPDADGWHNVSASSETISFSAKTGDTIEVYLTWDAWPTTNQDHDLYLFYSSPNLSPVASSKDAQTGTQPPTEDIEFVAPSGGTYYLKIQKYSATSNHRLELYSINHNLSPAVASSSLLSPADATGAMAVGAINYNKWAIGPQEPFSSRGPTNDGRIKPDIMGPDNVTNYTSYTSLNFGERFTGTSASSPHVAGAAALILEKNPSISVDQLWYSLTSTAIYMDYMKDPNIYGSGLLNLDIDAAIPSSTTVTSSGGGGGGCFIATAAYGSYAAPCVQILRKVRDRFLLTNTTGKSFVNMYYKYSPPLADFIADHNNLKVFVQLGLLPLVGISWLVLKFGPVPTTTLMIVFMLGLIRLVLKGISPVNGKTLPNGTK